MPSRITCKICGNKDLFRHSVNLAYFGFPHDYSCVECGIKYVTVAKQKCEKMKLADIEDRKRILFYGVSVATE